MVRPLDGLSGSWVGWWIQWGKRGHMRLRLVFADGRVTGNGSDESGSFTVAGTYRADGARLVKGYATHQVHYDGRWDGASLAGPWVIRYEFGTDRGEFEMWPESEGLTVEEILARADEAIEEREALPAGRPV